MKALFRKLSVLSAIAAMTLASCNKDNPGDDTPEVKPFDESPFAVTWQDFITENDVQILNGDTTEISISKKLVEKLGVTELNNRTVCIWTSLETLPFIRNVYKATEEDDHFILHSTRGAMTDLFHNLDIEFNSDLYVNHDYVPTKTTRGGTGLEVDDVSGKYIDENGVLHPAYIYIENPEMNDGVTKGADLNGPVVFSAEEMVAQNWEWNLVNINDLSIKFGHTFKFGAQNEEDPNYEYIDVGLYAHAGAKLTMFGGLKLKKLKIQEFKLGIKGDVNAGVKLKLAAGFKGKKVWTDYEQTLGKTRLMFWVGPIPLWYKVEPKLVSKTELSIDAHASLYSSASVEGHYSASSHYKRGAAWGEKDKNGKKSDWKHPREATILKKYGVDGIFPDEMDTNIGAELNITASLIKGLYWSTEVFMFDIAGPEYELGPRFGIEANITAKAEKHDKEVLDTLGHVVVPKEFVEVGFEANAFVGFGGEFGIKGKLFGYELFKFNYEYEIIRMNIAGYQAKYIYDLNTGEDSWETNWQAIVDRDDWYGEISEED